MLVCGDVWCMLTKQSTGNMFLAEFKIKRQAYICICHYLWEHFCRNAQQEVWLCLEVEQGFGVAGGGFTVHLIFFPPTTVLFSEFKKKKKAIRKGEYHLNASP